MTMDSGHPGDLFCNLPEEVLEECVGYCSFAALVSIASVSKRMQRASTAHHGGTLEMRRARAQAASVLSTLGPAHWAHGVRRWARGEDEIGEVDPRCCFRLSRLLREMARMEESFVSMLSDLDTMRAELTLLGLSRASSEAIFSCSEHLHTVHNEALLPGLQRALREVPASETLPLPVLVLLVLRVSEHVRRCAPLLALHAPFAANVLNGRPAAELRRLRESTAQREEPIRK